VRVLSLFSGVGGFDLGLERAGMEVVAQCDNDAFCNKVLAKHWPEVRRFGDVRDIGIRFLQPDCDGADNSNVEGWRSRREAIDLVCGGFPCQDLSVAGKRAGLDGDRSGLWFEFKRILSELRPRWAIIENVPGLLSSNQGRDFAILLDGLGECGFGGISWAVLDSQHFGVAQRRRRVYVVAGPSRRSVEQVLSLCESCGGHPQTRRTSGEDIAYGIGDGIAHALRARANDPHREDASTYVPVVSPTVTSKWSKGSGGRAGDEIQNLVGALTAAMGNQTVPGNTQVDANQLVPLAGALTVEMYHHGGVGNQSADTDGLLIPQVTAVRTAQTGSNGWGVNEDGTAYTLDGTSGQAVAGASVRRLTPVECERLQGFPDGWTDLGNTPDGPRYKAMGNAVSVPVIEWLGRRIMAVQS